MTALRHPVTGHQISTDDESVEFWQAAGYQAEKAPAKKAASKKSASKKSSK